MIRTAAAFVFIHSQPPDDYHTTYHRDGLIHTVVRRRGRRDIVTYEEKYSRLDNFEGANARKSNLLPIAITSEIMYSRSD